MRFDKPMLGGAAIVASAAILLSACSQIPDPETNVDSLTKVTEAPESSRASEKYDIEAHPEPIVDAVDCSSYLVITARGTGEPEQGQLLAPVARSIQDAYPDEARILNLDYPADTDVHEGGTLGVRTLLDTLRVQAEHCPDQRFVLLGYSQGAFVVGDALVSPAARLIGETTGELSEETAAKILTILLYGDPRFVSDQQGAVGDFDATLNGILPRSLDDLSRFATRIRDYCVARDFICQSTFDFDDETGHLAYFDNGMQQQGADFAIEIIKQDLAERSEYPGTDPGAEHPDR